MIHHAVVIYNKAIPMRNDADVDAFAGIVVGIAKLNKQKRVGTLQFVYAIFFAGVN